MTPYPSKRCLVGDLGHSFLIVGNITSPWPVTCLQGCIILCDSSKEEEIKEKCGSPPFNWGGGIIFKKAL